MEMRKVDGRSKAARAAKAKRAENAEPIAIKFDPQLPVRTASKEQVGGDHYMDMGVQPWDAMESWMTAGEFVGFLRGNSIKYLARCNKKGGVEDVKKARHYLNKLIEVMEGA